MFEGGITILRGGAQKTGMRSAEGKRGGAVCVWTRCAEWRGPNGVAEVEHNNRGGFRVTMGELVQHFDGRSNDDSIKMRDKAHAFAKSISGFTLEYQKAPLRKTIILV